MSDSKAAMLVRTRLDITDPTQASYQWAESVKGCFQNKGWQVYDFAVDDAIRAKVEQELKNIVSSVFLFYGHGQPDAMESQFLIPIIDSDNIYLLKNKIVYTVSCWTAKVLGTKAAEFARCYLGYKRNIEVWITEPYIVHLGKCVNKGIKSMINNPSCTIEKAREYIVDEYDYQIDYYTIGDGAFDAETALFAAHLRYNRDALAEVLGDKATTL